MVRVLSQKYYINGQEYFKIPSGQPSKHTLQNMLAHQLLRTTESLEMERVERSYVHLQCTTYSYVQALPSYYVLLNPCQQAHNGLPFGLPTKNVPVMEQPYVNDNYIQMLKTLICINLNDPTLGMGLNVMGIYIVVLLHRCAQISVNHFNGAHDSGESFQCNQNL